VATPTRGTGKVFVPARTRPFDHHQSMSPWAVMARIFMQKNKREPALGAATCWSTDLPEWKANKIDVYDWYYAVAALFQFDGRGGPMWKK